MKTEDVSCFFHIFVEFFYTNFAHRWYSYTISHTFPHFFV